MMIREIITNKNNKIFRSDAVLTRLSKSKNRITIIIKHEVNKIDTTGVPCFDILAKDAGNN